MEDRPLSHRSSKCVHRVGDAPCRVLQLIASLLRCNDTRCSIRRRTSATSNTVTPRDDSRLPPYRDMG
jgi:hypothetical protein